MCRDMNVLYPPPHCLRQIELSHALVLLQLSVSKSYDLLFRIDDRTDPEGDDAARHSMTDVYIKNDWKLVLIDYFDQ